MAKPWSKKSLAVHRPDLTAVLGLMIAFGGILGGLVMEGGRIADVSQITAALIVFGGTFGAVMFTTPFSILKSAMRKLKSAFLDDNSAPQDVIEEIVVYAGKARKNGIVSLEQDAAQIADPFLQKALMLAVDGTELQPIRNMMELEMRLESSEADTAARVFECAGGYAPTIGIIGAVLGLIQVMKHLDNITHVGSGIAIAFVATIYGVGSANLLFLPIGQKIRLRAHQSIRSKELMLEGVISIVEGMNPRLIRRKLEAFSRDGVRDRQPLAEVPSAASRAASA